MESKHGFGACSVRLGHSNMWTHVQEHEFYQDCPTQSAEFKS